MRSVANITSVSISTAETAFLFQPAALPKWVALVWYVDQDKMMVYLETLANSSHSLPSVASRDALQNLEWDKQ